ncbi:MAG: chitobiase/beta-hexosaminidase C-terminal domain-containing protein [Nitrospirae bacterium]|nr:chitobiase/beta-hexosaminidase C-terminal domain-containing protein [Nitrospirota bacterium]
MLRIKTLSLIVALTLMSSIISFGATITYQYDNLNRLTRVERSDGTVVVYQYDANGNRLFKVVTLASDTTPPTTTASPAGGTYASAQSVILSCNDGGGSGCANTYYCTGTGCTPTTIYTGALNISNSTDLRFYSIDNAGNSETTKTETYIIQSQYTITASAGTGGSISCSPNPVNSGSSSTCTITTDTNYSLSDVTVDGSSVGAVTSYTFSNVTADHTISATFTYTYTPPTGGGGGGGGTPSQYDLTITKSGNGTVTADAGTITWSGDVGTASYSSGTSVTLTAAANTGSTFTGWSGDCSGTSSTCTVTMNAARSVTATFTSATYTLTINKIGTGTGIVASSGKGVTWSGNVGTYSIKNRDRYRNGNRHRNRLRFGLFRDIQFRHKCNAYGSDRYMFHIWRMVWLRFDNRQHMHNSDECSKKRNCNLYA